MTWSDIYLGYNGELFYVIPIILSMRYYEPKFTKWTTVIAVVAALVASVVVGILGYMRYDIDVNSLEHLETGTSLVIDGSIAKTLVQEGYVSLLDVLWLKGLTGIAFAFAVLVVGVVAHAASQAGSRMLQRQAEVLRAHNEAEVQRAKHEREVARLENQITISQIKPHFLYNSLSTISALCEEDPSMARDALERFSDYMRANMNTMRKGGLVPLSQELEHTKTYVMLEQLRFGDDVRVEYDIQEENLKVPALSLQPLVENAIKHGICSRDEGGTVKVSTRHCGTHYEVVVEDDGVGFIVEEMHGDSHVGLENTHERLRILCNGELQVESELGVGTTVKMVIPLESAHSIDGSGDKKDENL